MFTFTYLDSKYTVSLDTGEPVVTPVHVEGLAYEKGCQAYVEEIYDDVAAGKYFPHPDDRERVLSEALGGDFVYAPKPEDDLPPGTVF